ncbi:hypothetical protein MHYP_G00301190 [Metynnis hypsauchen]
MFCLLFGMVLNSTTVPFRCQSCLTQTLRSQAAFPGILPVPVSSALMGKKFHTRGWKPSVLDGISASRSQARTVTARWLRALGQAFLNKEHESETANKPYPHFHITSSKSEEICESINQINKRFERIPYQVFKGRGDLSR